MAGMMDTNYNPARVMMKNPDAGTFGGGKGGPYLGDGGPRPVSDPRITGPTPIGGGGGRPVGGPRITGPVSFGGGKVTPPGNVLGSETVRASGSGPFDSAYRQNLATYTGGGMAKPGGNLSFNPTSMTPFGNPSGGGTDPIMGGPSSLLAMGLGGEGFSYTAPKPPVAKKGTNMNPDWQDWLSSRSRYGRGI